MNEDFFDKGPVVCMPDRNDPRLITEYANPILSEADEIGSFAQYCKGHFEYEWTQALGSLIAEEKVPVGKTSATVPNPDIIFPIEMDIQRMEFSRLDRLRFYADAIVVAKIEVSQRKNDYRQCDTLNQWYRLKHIVEAAPDGYTIHPVQASIYQKEDANPGLPLSEYLIPVLDKDQLEEEAEDILRRYYPEVFISDSAPDAELLAGRMGLRVLDVPLADETLSGIATFFDGNVQILQEEMQKDFAVSAGMILVNSRLQLSERDRTRVILHECCHHYEHDLFLWGQSLYHQDIIGFDYAVSSGKYPSGKHSPVFWAEQQARLLTYRVKMSRLVVKNWVSAQLEKAAQSKNLGRAYEQLIQSMARHFDTTCQSAKHRLLELGYTQFKGIFHYVDNKYIPPFFYPDDVLAPSQTFLISFSDALNEYGRNERFRQIIDSGHYLYVEGRFCINDSRYVTKARNGMPRITDYGRMHTEACCLCFEIRHTSHDPQYVWGELHMQSAATSNIIMHSAAEPGLANLPLITEEIQWSMDIRKQIGGMSFSEALKHLMTERHTTAEQLEERSGLSIRTLTRLRNEEYYTVTREALVAISVGLKLPPMVSQELLRIAGLSFTNSLLHNVYQMILASMYRMDIYTINDYLQGMGLPPLSKNT